MDDSQSSDIFSETSGNIKYSSTIETEKYEELVSKIKATAHRSVSTNICIVKDHFTVLLEDCSSCILQSLSLIISLLEDTNTEVDKLCDYIENAVCIIQILSNFVKTIIESVAITCSTVKNFGTCTGNIILTVFTHCKDSECIYGDSLCTVEKQLKDLFRNCHDLQLIYLMTLEKHMVFDLTEKEDQDILLKTLELNLKIGDVVQSLDVKTMAEQWKSYTMICEKHSNFLLDKNIFNTTSRLLASTTENNIRTALEANEEDKIVIRSLKVANFSLKILLRLCSIFKSSVNCDYEDITKLLLHMSLCNSTYYEITANKSSEFSVLINTHISLPTEIIVSNLVNEEQFLKLIFLTEINELRDAQLLGYLLLVITSMKAFLEKENVQSGNKDKVIACVFSMLPYCHKWFNIGLQFIHTTSDGKTQYHGLYDHLLLHTVALTSTLSPEQYKKLEFHLYEALLGTEYYSAIFAANLWVLICRLNNKQLQLEVLSGLMKVYQNLETHSLFADSPQRIHLSYTIENLFKTLGNEKMHIYKRYSIKVGGNIGIWSALKIRNLQNDLSKSLDRIVCENLYASFDKVLSSEGCLDDLIKNLKLASTCRFMELNSTIEDFLLNAWLKVCPFCGSKLQSVWLFRYLEGLASLTDCCMEKFERKTILVNILNIISNILHMGNIDTFYLLFKLYCKLSIFLIKNQYVVHTKNTLISKILDESDDIQNYINNILISDDDIGKLIIPVLKDSKDTWESFVEYKNKYLDMEEWHKKLDLVADNKFIHKCMETSNAGRELICVEINDIEELRKTKSNFDLGDIDSLFEDSDEEPVSKKAKLNFDVDNLIGKIEANVEQLCQVKDNVLGEYQSRITCVCDRLRNIIS